MPSNEVDVTRYRRDGYLLLPRFFPERDADAVRAGAKRIFLAQMRQSGLLAVEPHSEREFEEALFRYFASDTEGFVNCANQAQYLLPLSQLAIDPRVLDVLRSCGLEEPILNKYPTLYFNSRHLAKQEHYWRQREHQDWRFLQGSLDTAVLWVALVDIDSRLGALEVLPGSHRRGLLGCTVTEGYGKVELDERDETHFVPIEVRKGDALLFSSFLVHRAGVNVTRSIRWSCHFRYANLAEPTFAGRKFPHTYSYKPHERLITENFPTPEQLEAVFGS